MDQVLLRDTDAGVLTLTLHRPRQRNALDLSLATRLRSTLAELPGNRNIRAVLITGSGPAFCAGDDLEATGRWRSGSYEDTPNDPRTGEHLYLSVCRQLLRLPVPVVVAVNGPALGAGLSLVCAGDYRIAADSAWFAVPSLSMAHIGDVAMLSRTVGSAMATRMYLTGERIPAERAIDRGIVDQTVPASRLRTKAVECARGLAAAPTGAIGLFKELREAAWHTDTDTALRLQDRYHHRSHREIDDGRRAWAAHVRGELPEFKGN
ncbi:MULTISPECIES: enoyl-CoA hydratase/isomerase family protein [unclassified Streptomyces]|uniref:enoyl-CoA hydratase/isomerase family protein n=1 Tax=Streptomyces sp. NPDC127532 TaxID=3345399 RepID=UPI0036331249